jgi:hypothetical protein
MDDETEQKKTKEKPSCQDESPQRMQTKLMLQGKGIRIQRLLVHIKIEITKEFTKKTGGIVASDEEASESGTGISGRIAKAAGSAPNLWIRVSKGRKTR